ncbi:MAG: PTH1 family peptidyl-tRNA hydrolase [Gammaproteobacteria bacterium]|jgi:PTH1 family peptidyl-tRNA hydrolase
MPALTADLRLIVGLGNPGADYVDTRHNAGFWLVEGLARDASEQFRFDKKYNAEICKHRFPDREVTFMKPLTFMNHSGQSVGAFARYAKIKPEQILVMHDELDLPSGVNRIKFSGGHGGHNGLRDIISHLGSKDFFRMRIGIDHPGDRNQVINYVLHKPSVGERQNIDKAALEVLDVMPLVYQGRIDKAMQALHT